MPETVYGWRPTDAQTHAMNALDDVAEHVAWEFDPDEWRGVSTCGMAHVAIPDGRASFIQRVRSLADVDDEYVDWIEHAPRNRDGYRISIGGLDLSLRDGYRDYRLSITNIGEIVGGPEMQRLDVQERLHQLVLDRLQYDWDYLADSRVRSRMD